MSIGKIITAKGTKNVSLMKLGIFALFVGVFIVFGSTSKTFAQEGNSYEEPWHPAARFAVEAGGKKEKATITLVKVEKADFQTGEEGLMFQICMAVDVKKGSKKSVKQYAQTTVFRNDKTMEYVLKSWNLSKKPPTDCQ
jgi:hypothetical protein